MRSVSGKRASTGGGSCSRSRSYRTTLTVVAPARRSSRRDNAAVSRNGPVQRGHSARARLRLRLFSSIHHHKRRGHTDGQRQTSERANDEHDRHPSTTPCRMQSTVGLLGPHWPATWGRCCRSNHTIQPPSPTLCCIFYHLAMPAFVPPWSTLGRACRARPAAPGPPLQCPDARAEPARRHDWLLLCGPLCC
jgi:hypothetical protein